MKLELPKEGLTVYAFRNYLSNNLLRNYAHLWPLKKVLKMIENNHYDAIAEIGCADGIFLPSLSRLCKELYATDIYEPFIDNLLNVNISNLHPYLDDIQNSRLESNKFDLVVCLEVLEHIANPQKAISEISRIMKNNGYCIISVPIEIGLPVLVKYISRLILGYGKMYDGGYKFKELIKAILKKPDEEHHSKYLGHKGFDYRKIVELLKEKFSIEKIKYFPFNILGPNFNYRIILLCRK